MRVAGERCTTSPPNASELSNESLLDGCFAALARGRRRGAAAVGLVALASPLVTDEFAVPVLEDADEFAAVPAVLLVVLPLVSSPPLWMLPPVAVALAP